MVTRLVKARSVVFDAGDEQKSDVKRRIDDEVLPRFSEVPQFLGFWLFNLREVDKSSPFPSGTMVWRVPRHSQRSSETRLSASQEQAMAEGSSPSSEC